MSVRDATHAGTWYSSDPTVLERELNTWLDAAQTTPHPTVNEHGLQEPAVAQHPIVQGCKCIIAPHAGYRFSGPSAAWSYGCVDSASIDRVFVFGPSHRTYLEGLALSPFTKLATPLGNLDVDVNVNKQLHATSRIPFMSRAVDEAEHSLEMQYPYLAKVLRGRSVKVIPVLVGALNTKLAQEYASQVFATHARDLRTLFVFSSDFCHWGERFDYCYYCAQGDEPMHLACSTPVQYYARTPIYASIQGLDAEAMEAISTRPASVAVAQFEAYMRRTHNTICGRGPILLMLVLLALLETEGKHHQCVHNAVR
ncbi:hypothetical protein MVES_001959 [Malassezia vespertilionis]|uniref:Uncharacterized protein n=1 Tax=Malassezia vespertilionis TaxID=2020962 RepID=A0A2N1JC74_9BASI|nr:hypothetical protein MVES_001959 [Malassezia vespertilionis]